MQNPSPGSFHRSSSETARLGSRHRDELRRHRARGTRSCSPREPDPRLPVGEHYSYLSGYGRCLAPDLIGDANPATIARSSLSVCRSRTLSRCLVRGPEPDEQGHSRHTRLGIGPWDFTEQTATRTDQSDRHMKRSPCRMRWKISARLAYLRGLRSPKRADDP